MFFSMKPIQPYRLWTERELQLLRKNHAGMTDTELSTLIGRTVFSIRIKASALGLKKEFSFRKKTLKEAMLRAKAIGMEKLGYNWNEEDDKKLIALYTKDELTLADIAVEMKRAVSTIVWRIRKLKIPIKDGRNKRGYEGEQIATTFFCKQNWKIIEKGGKQTPYDFLVEIGHEKYAINVKNGNLITSLSNLRRLLSTGYSVVFLHIDPDKNIYFMPVQRVS